MKIVGGSSGSSAIVDGLSTATTSASIPMCPSSSRTISLATSPRPRRPGRRRARARSRVREAARGGGAHGMTAGRPARAAPPAGGAPSRPLDRGPPARGPADWAAAFRVGSAARPSPWRSRGRAPRRLRLVPRRKGSRCRRLARRAPTAPAPGAPPRPRSRPGSRRWSFSADPSVDPRAGSGRRDGRPPTRVASRTCRRLAPPITTSLLVLRGPAWPCAARSPRRPGRSPRRHCPALGAGWAPVEAVDERPCRPLFRLPFRDRPRGRHFGRPASGGTASTSTASAFSPVDLPPLAGSPPVRSMACFCASSILRCSQPIEPGARPAGHRR